MFVRHGPINDSVPKAPSIVRGIEQAEQRYPETHRRNTRGLRCRRHQQGG